MEIGKLERLARLRDRKWVDLQLAYIKFVRACNGNLELMQRTQATAKREADE